MCIRTVCYLILDTAAGTLFIPILPKVKLRQREVGEGPTEECRARVGTWPPDLLCIISLVISADQYTFLLLIKSHCLHVCWKLHSYVTSRIFLFTYMEGCFTAPNILDGRARMALFFCGKAICVPPTCSVFWILGDTVAVAGFPQVEPVPVQEETSVQ